jgi:hypothetical protein
MLYNNYTIRKVKTYLKEFEIFLHDVNVLFDVLADNAAAAHSHFNRSHQDAPSQGLHLPREGGAEHDHLLVRPAVVYYAHNL